MQRSMLIPMATGRNERISDVPPIAIGNKNAGPAVGD